MTDTMKRLVLRRSGLDGLVLETAPIPTIGRHDLLVRMTAASLNRRDLLIVRGEYGSFPLPLVPVSDGVGKVVAAGSAVTRFAIGDRASPAYVPDWVAGAPRDDLVRRRLGGPLDGVLSEYVLVNEHAAVRPPVHLDDVQAATLPIAGVTAFHVLFADGRIVPGDVVVVRGTGGVATMATLLARQAGARVIALSRSRPKLHRMLALGAHEAIDVSEEPAWDARVRELTGGAGAELVIDLVGGQDVDRCVAACRIGGAVALVGFAAGTVAPVDLVAAMRRMVVLRGVSVGSRASYEGLVRAMEHGRLVPVVDAVHPWTDAAAALATMDRDEHLGKIALSFAR
ncbi:MAG: alcohol dehydrogenase [Labilithrix sp.]|nr:alcohol dehydrogenase [Labilithrix sp.]